MGLPKFNYTPIPNSVLDSLSQLSGAELKIITFICRQTFGYQRLQAKMSLSFIVNGTGLSRQGVVNTTEVLIQRGLVQKTKSEDSFDYSLLVNSVDYLKDKEPVVKSVDQSSQLTNTSQLSRPGVVNSVDSNKERSLKKEEIDLCAISGEIAPRQTSDALQVSDPERETVSTVSVEAGKPHAQEQPIAGSEPDKQVSGTKKQKRKKRSAAAIYAETVEKERFDKFWDSYTAFCKKYDARPGSKALAAEAWTDLISSGTLLGELRSGVMAYFKQIKQMKHAYGIPHACNFLAGSKVHPEPYWREALDMDQPKADLRGNEFEDQTKANGQDLDVTAENSEQVFEHLKSLTEAKQIINYRTEGDGSVRVQILSGRWRSCRDVLQMFPIEAEAKKQPYTNRALEPSAA